MIRDNEPTNPEVGARSVTSIAELADFIVQAYGITPTEDPYARKEPGTPVRMSWDKRYSSNGMVEFGKKFDVHRKVVGKFEFVYARSSLPDKSEILVNRFAEQEGLELRMWLTQQDGVVHKRLELPPWGAQDMNPHSYIKLGEQDVQALLAALQNPEDNLEVIEMLVAPSEEEATQLEEDRLRIAEFERRFREEMKALRQAELESARDLLDQIF